MRLGSIEAGGTKFVCAIGNENGEVFERGVFPTTSPEETMEKVIEFFKGKEIEAMGVGCFGPLSLNPKNKDYGAITTTPKVLWQNYNIVNKLKEHFNIPIGFDTDVNIAALGEYTWGGAKGLDSCFYMTVGTGVGAGIIAEGKMIHGLLHPEVGHMIVPKHPEDDFEGICPFHKNCLEGLACGPAIEKRWGKKGHELPADHKAWDIEAYYLSIAVVETIVMLSPEKIILGGGVMKQSQLFEKIRKQVKEMLNGYINVSEITENIDEYIIYPKLGDNAGISGGLALAKQVLQK
ncbi:putative fructokinase [Fusobacterium sp. DD29]|uniref:ROK family protein n=1 Tax=unclassified Fusobacterium TaxID=2648384 RepID=UPI001B8C4CD2|nr:MULTISPECIES: ROK family protein [unclassified Fusobacterium]MBR8700973.1 putative fructokinase [Fusobacterium sp. DD45]MBR8710839.1 putative fructokinase [Fusobacterium sp. DD28]MBR8748494.1 putative fructokinase [Fusobacterium sp. DD29]MBR8751314.1 putative fructokinase [Fusobacterium sp. DD26]MBR8760761.1 putative fructokinase [Fusobacterium sp. DD25]